MATDKTASLLSYLIAGVQGRGGTPIRTQLVKLLYLVDLEHYRRVGKTATELPWVFYHYGPYAFELESILGGLPDVDEEEFTSAAGRRGVAYKLGQELSEAPEQLDAQHSPLVRRMADRILNEWALVSLWELLDYVYFETEPMQEATRGQPLDFSKVVGAATMPKPAPSRKLNADTIAELRALAEQTTIKEKGTTPTAPPYDDVYWGALRKMSEED